MSQNRRVLVNESADMSIVNGFSMSQVENSTVKEINGNMKIITLDLFL